MYMNRMLSLLALTAVLCAPAAYAARPQPSNRIAILVDASGSYRARQAEAVERATQLIGDIAGERVDRWDRGLDQISVISLDAMPEEIFRGSVRELKAQDREAWTRRFHKRTDYAQCTDVTRAFQVAVRFLDEGDTRYTTRYLYAFSDLRHEPPLSTMRACSKPAAVPSDFPWEELRGVAAHVLWMPADQKLAWQRMVEAHDTGVFHLYTDSESEVVHLTRPRTAVLSREVLAEEHAADRERYGSMLGSAGRLLLWAGATVLGFALLGILAAGLRRWQRRRQLRASGSCQTGRVV